MPNEVTVTPDEVRSAIDPTMPAAALPDATINRKLYKDAAIREVKERDPDYADRTGEDAARLNSAADLICAALLIENLPNITQRGVRGGISITLDPISPEERALQLRARADAELSEVLGEDDVTELMPVMFTLGTGTRGL